MIPLQDENPSSTIPFVNFIFILANISIFMYQKIFTPGRIDHLYYQLGCIPYEFTHFVDINPPSLVPVPFTIFTAMFMHGGWIHLFSNMLFLWIFGDNVEDILGHVRYLFFYMISGIFASLFHIFTNVNSQIPSVGASGAIAGVMGAYIFLFPKARIKTLLILGILIQIVRIPAVIILGYWIFIQFLSGFAEFGSQRGGGIAWFAHIGGFVVGFFLIIIMKKRRQGAYQRK
ncbi:MAG: rhomboid family intramembrane serine protease [Thermodesulfobacteriota bacterium]|nr:rhomboid family intramembrane serine protease [Thermodesulfobacteriota bacterium]